MEDVDVRIIVGPDGKNEVDIDGNLKTVKNYKTTTLSYIRDISFNVTEDNIYYFDMSHESNKGSRLRFFSDYECKIELMRNYNSSATSRINYNTIIWDDNETLAEYSKNIDPGFEGAFVKIKIPKYSQIQGSQNKDPIKQIAKIYYKK